ncbi:potassium voltage-gated channel subfamily A member 2-like [Dendronephthya gigantea]|uniref:potassium voltage-gated channel subfamily A member 2-like n=1 Tax=Dendronephthya gigantea TaxID=151771 RepID=UPI00106CD959|nr:potassium voltage-gated channel subfamily A member 2-like [Dendronephthya gigantea]
MNYAVHSATAAVAFNCRRPSITRPKVLRPESPTRERRITINVGGERFQTYETTLDRYPDSLLGSPERRKQFYNEGKGEFVFPSRNKEVFNAILFFYQARILSRPEDVSLKIFVEEIKFFDLAEHSHEIPAQGLKTPYIPPNNTRRHRIWNFLENPKTKIGKLFAKFNLFLVFTWLVILCLETSSSGGKKLTMTGNTTDSKHSANESGEDYSKRDSVWFILDTFFVIWFSVDYLLHMVSEPSLRSYILSPLGIIDLITIIPYYIKLITQTISSMRLVRFLRVFRLFKATRYSSAFRILLGSLTSSAKDFPVWFVLLVMHILFFSSILYYVESEVNNPQFATIPDVMYFTVITMCAVGYGDQVPQSTLGKLVTSFAALSGIVIVYCIPAPTLKTNFNRLNELYKSEKKEREKLKCNGASHGKKRKMICYSTSKH